MEASFDRPYAFCGYRLDARTRELFDSEGAPVPLTSKTLDVLLQQCAAAFVARWEDGVGGHLRPDA